MLCLEDRADPPLQKENANFCDFYSPRSGAFEQKNADKGAAARTDLHGLFGADAQMSDEKRDDPEPAGQPPGKEELAKKKLDDLFG